MNAETVIKAINNLDLNTLSLDNVELLQKMIPTDQESKLYKDYVIEKKNISLLTEEDKFMLNLTKVERIASKLSIMNYMGNFFDSIHLISPVCCYYKKLCAFQFIDSHLITFLIHLLFVANLFNYFRINIGQVIEEVQITS
jgi:hypothetical protein